MFSASERVLYGKRQLIEVICHPFSDDPFHQREGACRISGGHPRRVPALCAQSGKLPPKVIGQPGAMKLEEQPTVVNYQFLTAAGDWKVNLTNTFLCAGHTGLYDVGGFCPEARRGAGTVRRHLSPGVF